MRAIVGIIAGVLAGYAIAPGTDQTIAVGISIMIAIAFYIISVAIGRTIAKNVPKEHRRKVVTSGIFPFIFLLIMFMILIYTALHQSMIS